MLSSGYALRRHIESFFFFAIELRTDYSVLQLDGGAEARKTFYLSAVLYRNNYSVIQTKKIGSLDDFRSGADSRT